MSSNYSQPMPPPHGPHGPWPSAPEPKKWYQRKGVVIPAAVVGGLFVLGLIVQAAGLDQPKGPASSSAVAAPTVTVTAPEEKPVAHAAAAPRTTTAPRTTAPHSTHAAAPTPASDRWTMPNETGKTLQAAQDDIQDVTDDGIFYTRSHDATGADRHQILDRGWQVCSQSVAAGDSIDAGTDIVFDVVRVSETCP